MSVNINADTTNGLVLTSDTSGEIKLQSAGADIATVTSSGITMASGKTLPASALTGSLPAGMGGKILQVVQTVKADEFTGAGAAWRDVTGMTATITPASTSNKIMVMYSIAISAPDPTGLRLYRGTTHIAQGNSGPANSQRGNLGNMSNPTDGNRGFVYAMQYLDSPATTSATTYKLQTFTHSQAHYVNRTVNNTSSNYNVRGISTITLLEVAG